MKKFTRTGKMLLCLVLAAAVLTGLLAMGASKDWTGATLGALSHQYETGSNPDPGQIVELPGDSGGPSYGIYMFASNAGVPRMFFNWLREQPAGTLYQQMGERLYNAYSYNSAGQLSEGYGSNFKNAWQTIALQYPVEFMQAQKDYWMNKHYIPLVQWMEKTYPNFDIDNYSVALKNVLWSRSVHHGYEGATGLISNAIPPSSFANMAERDIIKAIYDRACMLDDSGPYMTSAWAYKYGIGGKSMKYFSANSGTIQEGVYNRLRINEPYDALVMMLQNSSAPFVEGVYILSSAAQQANALTDAGTVSAENVSNKMTLTWFEGNAEGTAGKFYTITNSAGKRLTANSDDTVKFADAATGSSQFWRIADTTGGYTLQSVGTGKYVFVEEGGALKLYTAEALTAAGKTAFLWQPKAQADIIASNFVLPDANSVLVVGNSGFNLRGVINCALPITQMKVTVTVDDSNGLGVGECPQVIKTGNKTYFDLWDLDSPCKISALKAGKYKITVTAQVNNVDQDVVVASSTFEVKQPTTQQPPAAEKVTVTFKVGETVLKTQQYEVGEVYGVLPEATQAGSVFRGWFIDDQTQVTSTTMVAAADHTLTAKFDAKYTVTFDPANGKAATVYTLASGAPIPEPEGTVMKNPVDDGAYTYTYEFTGWYDAAGNKYDANNAFVGSANITYTAKYTEKKTENPKPEQPTTPPDGTGTGTTQPPAPPKPVDGGTVSLKAQTKVSSLIADGYKIYQGSTEITGTNAMVGTGMKLVYGNVETTVIVTGDTSGDGLVNVLDVLNLRSHILKKNLMSGAYEKAADLNGDKMVDISDVLLATQYALGKKTFG